MHEIIERARSGDSEAFILLFETHKQALWKTAKAVLKNEADVADALQETALKAWKAIPAFTGKSSIETWLTRIILNTSFDLLQKAKKEAPLSAMIYDVEGEDGLAAPCISESDYLHAGNSLSGNPDHASSVNELLAQLHPGDRLILTLFYINDQPIKEIAAITRSTEGAVRTRLSRARERFRTLLQEEQDREVAP